MSEIVMLHGWGTTPAVFDELAERLDRRHRVRAPALPLTSAMPEHPSQRCVVLGWSLGAQIALGWACATQSQVERLVLVSATPCFVQRDDWRHGMDAAVFDAFARSVEMKPDATLERFAALQAHGDRDPKRVTRALRAARASAAATDVLRGGLDLLRDTDLRPMLERVSQPALVIHGANDTLIPQAAVEYLALKLDRAELEIVPGAAHAPFISDAARVAAAIERFLA